MNSLLLITTISLIALSGLYFCSLLWSGFRRTIAIDELAKAELNLFEAQANLILNKQKENKVQAEHNWENFRKFKIIKKQIEAKDTCSFYLAPHDERPLPSFRPGQYLTFQLSIPGQKKPVIRCYSLSSSASESGYYRLTVKMIPPPRDSVDVPPGLASNFFHGSLEESDIIDVKAPSGHFYFDLSNPHPAVLIGGGIGLTPVLSMLDSMIDAGYSTETWFFYGVRNGQEHAMKKHLEDLSHAHDWLHLRVCYSAPAEDDIFDEDFQQEGRVSVELFKKLLPSNNYHYYMCGPGPMMNSVVHDLEEWGVPTSSIHFEAFGPASVKKVKEAHVEPGVAAEISYQVQFAKSGKSFEWNGEFDSLLEFAEEHDIPVDFGCRAGNCGSCTVAVNKGDVELIQEVGADCESGCCLTCVSVPRSDLVIDA